MSFSKTEILRKSSDPKMKKVMGGHGSSTGDHRRSVEGHGRSLRGSRRSVGDQGGFMGDH